MNPDRRQAVAASFLPPALRRALAADFRPDATLRLGKHAALLWCDIAAFTPLASRLVGAGAQGAEQLHALLNGYYGALLDCVAHHGGEPQIFAGDAVLIAWPGTEAQAAVALAVGCAQEALRLELPRDDRGEPLRMHVNVSQGRFELLDLGDQRARCYVPIGDALDDLRSIRKVRAPGRIVVSARAARLARLEGERPENGDALILASGAGASARGVPLDVPVPSIRLDPWLPPPVATRLDGAQLAWVAELRSVTAVFALLEDLDHVAPQAADRFAALAAAVRPVIERHEAVLNQIVVDENGPTLLAYLGIPPFAHADDAVRGVRLATDLVKELRLHGVRARVGVTTARAYCGVVGNDLRRHYTVVGSHVNLGARLMVAASADTGPLCDDATRLAASAEIDFEPRPAVHAKGYDLPVNTWRPLRRRGRRRAAPTVGRERELTALEEELERLRGTGGVIAVVGDAGIGKSQLLAALRAKLDARVRLFEAAASLVGHDAVYHAWRSLFERLFDVDLRADVASRRAHVLGGLDSDLLERSGLLNAVLPYGFPDSAATLALSGEQRSTATRWLLKTLLVREAAKGPMLVTLEDAHLCDAASWDLVRAIYEDPGAVLLVLTSRPEGDERLMSLAAARRIELGRLDEKGIGDLAAERLGAERVADELLRWVAARSAGHPFAVIELVRALQHAGVLAVEGGVAAPLDAGRLAAVEVPQTIQGLITHRLDRLPTGPLLTLKVAAVIGATFPAEGVCAVHPVEDERPHVPAQLAALGAQRLVRTLPGTDPESHAFEHDLVCDVAYGLLPHAQRRELHRAIALWYEARFAADLASYFATLAHHFERDDDPGRAADYLEREAIRSFSLGLAGQSVALGLRAARLLGLELPADPAAIGPRIGENMAAIGAALAGRAPRALQELPALADARVERLIWLLLRIGPFAFQARQIELFALMAVTGLRLTLEHGNGAPSADVYSMYSVVHRALTGDDRVGAYRWSELALEMDARTGRKMRSRVAFVHTWFHHHWTHPLRESCAIALEGAEAGFAAQDILFACFNLSAHVVYLAASGAPLPEVMRLARAYLERNGRRVMNAAFHLIHELQVAKALAGLTEAPLSLTDAEFHEARDIASICDTELGNQIGYYLVSRVKLHAHFGDWAGAIKWAGRALLLKPAFEGQVAEIELVFFHGLALLQQAAALEPAPRRATLDEARRLVGILRGWAALDEGGSRSPDFEHRVRLLEAELAEALGGSDAAGYEAAARIAQRNGYLQDVGLAHELQARRMLAAGRAGEAQAAAARAARAYETWGALAKVRMVRDLAGVI